ncbi:MAG: hypothetical protein AAFP03_12695 [Cyanobacteria bacterium J06598_3]
MATPPFLRDLAPRLKPLASPAVWAPLTIAGLLGIFVWEFSKNPDWFNRDQITNLNPDSNLTPEEQARLSEIDTLDILLEQSRGPEGALPANGLINLDDDPDLEATGEDGLSGNRRQLTGKTDPFGAYEAEYAFPGSNTATLTPNTLSSTSAAGSPPSGGNSGGTTNFNFGNGVVNPAAPATNSALAEALNRQQAARNAADNNSQPLAGADSAPANSATISSEAPIGRGQSSAPIGSGQVRRSQPTGSAGLQALPTPSGGVTVPFTPAAAASSPPVGTTGYRPPATSRLPVFNTPPPQATPNPISVQNNNFQNNLQPPAAAPQSNTIYTAPSSVQPQQNQRR